VTAKAAFEVLDGPEDQAFVDTLFRCLDAGVPVVPLNRRLPETTRRAQIDFLRRQALFEDAATVLFTSGSSARPKAVVHDVNAHVMSARGANANIPLGAGDRWLVSLPLYHVGGLAILFRCREAGAEHVLRDPDCAFAEQIVRDQITHLSLVPTQLQDLLDAAVDLSGLKAILLGGAVIPPALVERAVAAGLPLHTTYGMTETASQVTTTRPGATLDELATAGSVLKHRELSFDDGGQILVRGPVRFLGYAGEARLDPQVWFETGDVGALDEHGRLQVEGRLDNQFISGGENIHPETIERALLLLPDVTQAKVLPKEDARYGQRPVAFVEAPEFSPEIWAAELSRSLPKFMVPVAFYPWPTDLPNGLKISRATWSDCLEKSLGKY